jgi:hypothetical protein
MLSELFAYLLGVVTALVIWKNRSPTYGLPEAKMPLLDDDIL